MAAVALGLSLNPLVVGAKWRMLVMPASASAAGMQGGLTMAAGYRPCIGGLP